MQVKKTLKGNLKQNIGIHYLFAASFSNISEYHTNKEKYINDKVLPKHASHHLH